MEGSVGQTAEFTLASISELSSSSSSSVASSSPAAARFYTDSGVAELRFHQQPESDGFVNVDLQSAQVFLFFFLID